MLKFKSKYSNKIEIPILNISRYHLHVDMETDADARSIAIALVVALKIH